MTETRSAFGEYFGIDLANRPPTLTVRGRARTKDGQIHIDSKTKLITVLIYFNRRWGTAGGCLRLLRSPDDIEDVIVEVPPESGTLARVPLPRKRLARTQAVRRRPPLDPAQLGRRRIRRQAQRTPPRVVQPAETAAHRGVIACTIRGVGLPSPSGRGAGGEGERQPAHSRRRRLERDGAN